MQPDSISHTVQSIGSENHILVLREFCRFESLNKQKGYKHLYIDGGLTIQGFLKEDLIDEMIITVIPILLGGGIPLFGELLEPMEFEHVKTEVFLDALVQNHYRRKK